MVETDRRVRALCDRLEQGWTDTEVLEWARTQRWRVGEQQLRRYLRAAEQLLEETPLPDRHRQRRRALAQLDVITTQAKASQDFRSLGVLLGLQARLSGALVAAEEAAAPSVWSRLRALIVRLDDLNLGALEENAKAKLDLSREGWQRAELRAARLLRLLSAADDLAAEFRTLGPPPPDEAQRRQWVARANAKALYLRLTMPGVSPAARAEAAYRHGGTAGMLSSNTEIADLAEELRKLAKKK